MAIATDLHTLDYEYAGTPFFSNGGGTELDVEWAGQPFFTQPQALQAGSNAIIVTAVEADFLVGSRRLPNRRKEAEKESQIKHVEPPCPPQVVSFLP